MRKEAASAVLAGAVAVAALFGGACATDKSSFQPPSKEPGVSASPFGPLERLNRLLEAGGPKEQNFDQIRQLFKAAREIFCGKIPCSAGIQQTPNNILELPTQEMFKVIEQRLGRTLSPEEQQENKENVLTVLDSDILINIDQLEEIINPKPGEYLHDWFNAHQDLDRRNVILSTSLIRALGDAVQTNQIISFDEKTSKNLTAISYPIKIEGMVGFSFIGEDQKGEITAINGVRTISSQLVSDAIGIETSGYIIEQNETVDLSRRFIGVNIAAGISLDEFVLYAIGSLPIEEMLIRWGALVNQESPEITTGITALAILAFGMEKSLSPETITKNLENYLRGPNQTSDV